jgi:hypothetical protein
MGNCPVIFFAKTIKQINIENQLFQGKEAIVNLLHMVDSSFLHPD